MYYHKPSLAFTHGLSAWTTRSKSLQKMKSVCTDMQIICNGIKHRSRERRTSRTFSNKPKLR